MSTNLSKNIRYSLRRGFDVDNFNLMEILGEGSFGCVHKGCSKDDPSNIIAIKEILIGEADENDLENLKKEITILAACDNENIVQYVGSSFQHDKLWIAMDYCGVGSIRDIIETCERTLSEEQISYITAATVDGLAYLHENKIIHRDIKAANILLNEQGIAKIADFGVSKQLNNTLSKKNTVIGTPLWMSPEVIKGMNYDNKADSWSLGITVIEMADGVPPHSELHPLRAMFQIPYNPPPSVEDPSEFSDELNDFLSKCLVKDPKDRASCLELKKHPFVKKGRKKIRAINRLIETYIEIKTMNSFNINSSDSDNYLFDSDSYSDDDFGTLVIREDDSDEGNMWNTTVINDGTVVFRSNDNNNDDGDDDGNMWDTTVINNGTVVIRSNDDDDDDDEGNMWDTTVFNGDTMKINEDNNKNNESNKNEQENKEKKEKKPLPAFLQFYKNNRDEFNNEISPKSNNNNSTNNEKEDKKKDRYSLSKEKKDLIAQRKTWKGIAVKHATQIQTDKSEKVNSPGSHRFKRISYKRNSKTLNLNQNNPFRSKVKTLNKSVQTIYYGPLDIPPLPPVKGEENQKGEYSKSINTKINISNNNNNNDDELIKPNDVLLVNSLKEKIITLSTDLSISRKQITQQINYINKLEAIEKEYNIFRKQNEKPNQIHIDWKFQILLTIITLLAYHLIQFPKY
eukprot:TRINITY_DN3990_c0_g2_i1.p1 TRINITY_DN3990_c0_g2~~TRINITY_DN3990_c0_g2_i1.p1  ORF type:complete len:684 (-),score=238.63 TRINITY_DN3990_c0_g2_i1:81-2132(-)